MTPKRYLGDGVYASNDGWHIWLTLDGGANPIALDPGVLFNLIEYAESLGFEVPLSKTPKKTQEVEQCE